jgi:hypothetical protein
LPRHPYLDIALHPELAMVREVFEGAFHRSECSSKMDCHRDRTFPVHHKAVIRIEECNSNSFDNYESALYRGTPAGPALISHHCLTSYPDKGGYTWQAEAGFYTLRVFGDQDQDFRVIFTHPN